MDSWKLVLMTGLVALGGVGVGATVFGSQPAQAQRPQFRECFVARQESLDTNGESRSSDRIAATSWPSREAGRRWGAVATPRAATWGRSSSVAEG